MVAEMLREEASADSPHSESLSVLDGVPAVIDGVSDGRCSGHRRSQSVPVSVRAFDALTSVGEPTQITRIPLNGIRTSSVPNASVRISAHPTQGNVRPDDSRCQARDTGARHGRVTGVSTRHGRCHGRATLAPIVPVARPVRRFGLSSAAYWAQNPRHIPEFLLESR